MDWSDSFDTVHFPALEVFVVMGRGVTRIMAIVIAPKLTHLGILVVENSKYSASSLLSPVTDLLWIGTRTPDAAELDSLMKSSPRLLRFHVSNPTNSASPLFASLLEEENTKRTPQVKLIEGSMEWSYASPFCV